MAKANKIIDYISGVEVNPTPEEVQAVQVFARQLVEDYGYDKNQIQTRPQYRVKTRPSGEKEYPIDIAIFENDNKRTTNYILLLNVKRRIEKMEKANFKIILDCQELHLVYGLMAKRDCFLEKLKRKEKFYLRKFQIFQERISELKILENLKGKI